MPRQDVLAAAKVAREAAIETADPDAALNLKTGKPGDAPAIRQGNKGRPAACAARSVSTGLRRAVLLNSANNAFPGQINLIHEQIYQKRRQEAGFPTHPDLAVDFFDDMLDKVDSLPPKDQAQGQLQVLTKLEEFHDFTGDPDLSYENETRHEYFLKTLVGVCQDLPDSGGGRVLMKVMQQAPRTADPAFVMRSVWAACQENVPERHWPSIYVQSFKVIMMMSREDQDDLFDDYANELENNLSPEVLQSFVRTSGLLHAKLSGAPPDVLAAGKPWLAALQQRFS